MPKPCIIVFHLPFDFSYYQQYLHRLGRMQYLVIKVNLFAYLGWALNGT